MATRKLLLRSFGSLLVAFSLAKYAHAMQATSSLPADWQESLQLLKQNPTGREWLAAHSREKYSAFSGKTSDDIPESWCAVGSMSKETAKGKSVTKNYFFIPEDGSLPAPGAPSEVIRQCRLGMIMYEFDTNDSAVAEEWLNTMRRALDKRFPGPPPEEPEGTPNFPYPWIGVASWEEKRFFVWLLRHNTDKTRAALVTWNQEYWELTYEPTHALFMDLAKPAMTPLERASLFLETSRLKNQRFEIIESKISDAAGARVYGDGPQDPVSPLEELANLLQESGQKDPADRATALFLVDQAIEALMWAYDLNGDDPGNAEDYKQLQGLGAKLSGVGSRGDVVYSHNLAMEAAKVAPFSPAGQQASLNLMRHRFYPSGCQITREATTQTIQEGQKLLSGNISPETRSEAEFLTGDAYAELAALNSTNRSVQDALDHYQRVLANHAHADLVGRATQQIWRLRANLPGKPWFECSKGD